MEQVNRDKTIAVPVSQEEKDMAEKEADKLGMPVSTFIRLLLKNWADGIDFKKKV